MLPDITSNTWAKKHFYSFLKTENNLQYTIVEAWREMVASSLVAAVVATAAAGGIARRAVAILVVAIAARGPRVVREAVPIALVTGFSPSRAAAGAAA
jgi:hypothetical protein